MSPINAEKKEAYRTFGVILIITSPLSKEYVNLVKKNKGKGERCLFQMSVHSIKKQLSFVHVLTKVHLLVDSLNICESVASANNSEPTISLVGFLLFLDTIKEINICYCIHPRKSNFQQAHLA